MFNFKVLLLISGTALLAYFVHLGLKRMIDPRRSVVFFLLYIAAHLMTVLLLVFIFGLVFNYYRPFFIS
ncbi:MAG: hypothetical protein ABIO79_00740 [Ferruginibacter sp.]